MPSVTASPVAPARWREAAPPEPVTSFVGRATEIRDLGRILADSTARFVTLVGPGGVGKSRLALELARTELAERGGRVAVVDLGGLADAALVPATVAAALGVGDQGAEHLAEAVAEALADGAESDAPGALLVLDNIEHVLAAGDFVADLLSRVPGLQALVTTRIPLRRPGERVVEVEPLTVPATEAPGGLGAIASSEAVELFLARAADARPDFRLGPSTAPAIAAIVRRLDGLPLAIELAAAVLRTLGPHQLLDRIASGGGLAVEPGAGAAGGRRGAPGDRRGIGLRATIESSHALLPPPVRVLYRRLAVFLGPFRAELARAVVERGVGLGLTRPEVDVVAGLDALADASLLRRSGVAAGEREYRMLGTIRDDAMARLDDAGERALAEWAHVHELLARAEACDAALAARTEGEVLDRLDGLRVELGAALETATRRAGDDVLLRLAGALGEYWRARSALTEGRLHLELALRRTTGRRDAPRAKAAYAGGHLAYRQGDFGRGRDLLGEALELRRELGDRTGEAATLNLLALIAFDEGRLETAEALAAEGLEIRRSLGDEAAVAGSLNTVGGIRHFRGALESARSCFEECLAIRRRLGDVAGISVCLGNVGLIDRDLGQLDEGATVLEEALDTRRRLGDRQREAIVVHNLGLVRLEQGRLDDADRCISLALSLARAIGDRVEIANALGDLATVERERGDLRAARTFAHDALALAHRTGALGVVALAIESTAALAAADDPSTAARFWAAADAIRRRTGYALLLADRRRVDTGIAAARARTSPETWAAEWAAGAGLAVDDAVAAALAATDAG